MEILIKQQYFLKINRHGSEGVFIFIQYLTTRDSLDATTLFLW